MSEPPRVSVLVPTRERCAALRRLLDSLREQTVPASAYEVVVAVDGSTDGTLELVDSLDVPYALRRVSSPARGRAVACNAAVAAARGEVLIILDDDMQVGADFVERHERHHPPGSRVCVMGAAPVVLDDSSPLAARYVRTKFAAHLARLEDADHRRLPRSFYSGNVSLRAELMREVGGFDEGFRAYGNEDVELALRLRDAGASVGYDPEARAAQAYDKGLGALARDTVAKGQTTVWLARARPDVFGQLRLATPRDASLAWLAARGVLLGLTRRRREASGLVFAAARGLERAGLWRSRLFYRALLDYAFWAGVDAELGEPTDGDELRRLAAELRRGPIDLLLHR